MSLIKIGSVELPEFPLLLAPMEDVSDPPFRALCKEQGCDMMYTEFISVEGLIRDAEKSVRKLDIYEEERPIGVQIFGAEYDSMMRAAEIVEEAKPELLDINYGCPVQKVVCKLAGAGILKDIPKMVSLTEAVVKSTNLPVTVKTRLGWDDHSIFIEDVAERLQDIGIKALTIHARTRAQMYKGHSDWSWISKVKNNPRIHIPIFGNGDIDSPQKALEFKNRYDVDGIMIGRASIGYPWIFREIKHYFNTGEILPPPSLEERVNAALNHLKNSIRWKGERLGVLEMRRHYTNYFKGLPGIKEHRAKLVTELDPLVLFEILDQIQFEYSKLKSLELV
ncbi:MAG: tRNA dihydrouridine synthase DusB [Saprospiraceae bacterium]|nr:tRNA dihydrouridine synthase DusB [Candidatus Vicinibacter affinis]MBP6172249.1 tRNA dihydrouridine synthase DusB [Saprospiraceae bacterium]MBK7305161.1 tRNA dihydrouridine synthase DusB [Candidatus Vicinibacter affinis]MBK7799436.1 tRNA dihydrouridine synthase DusB [Candidatus Vicinibacter affinis]MBK8642934.1 tRNA dihydrouridine synthase DusB [Candidatus Vicinibacter affinis]